MDTALTSTPRDETPDDAPATPPYRRPLLVLLAVLALLAAALGGYWLGGNATPTADSVDAGFARDMSLHHEQAVRMAALVYDRSDDPAIRSLAFDILTTQQGQIGIMSGWLDAWGLPWTWDGPRIAWMGMPTEGLMPGMATDEQMTALRDSTGEDTDRLFIQLMIPHHVSAIHMAEEIADRTSIPAVLHFVRSVNASQQREIHELQLIGEELGLDLDASPTSVFKTPP